MDNKDLARMLINFNRFAFLDNKDYIQKYYKLRKLHAEILQYMTNLVTDGKYDPYKSFKKIEDDYARETGELPIEFDFTNHDDLQVFSEVFYYKNHRDLKSLTEILLEKNVFRKKEKVKLLEAMNNSYVSLFEITGGNNETGYIYLKDVFSDKTFKIIDVSRSAFINDDPNLKKEFNEYLYNRIITYDDISFGTGLPIVFKKDNASIKKYIKDYKKRNISDFSRCIELYTLHKHSSNYNIVSFDKY